MKMSLDLTSLYPLSTSLSKEVEITELKLIREGYPARFFLELKNGIGEVRLGLSKFRSITYTKEGLRGDIDIDFIGDETRKSLELFGYVFAPMEPRGLFRKPTLIIPREEAEE